ncbi:hypothetical protein [Mycobacterium sp.]|uniref:hypothetical protein n=1 Tax=Mycobacterium sp. TaxID=1785 RepID=UPI003F9BA6CE
MTQATYYTRFPRRPSIRQDKWETAALALGALAVVTSWHIIGIGLGTAAVAAGVVARSHATPGARKRPTAAVSIGLGTVSIVVGVMVLGTMR